MAGTSIARSELEDYVSNANEVVFFKLIENVEDLEEDLAGNTFHPDYSHQIFGETESIFGYKKLKVRLFYTASRLIRYVNLSWDEMVSRDKSDVEPDDVMKIIKEKVGGEFITNIDTFSELLLKEKSFKPFGEMIRSFDLEDKMSSVNGEKNVMRTFEVFHSEMTTKGFQAYHEQMQTFLLWFIDAASYIDVDDEKWDYFVIYEKTNGTSAVNGDCNASASQYNFVGYMTVYRYYAYPEKVRPRISQVLVLPPFQRKGVGVEFLQTVYNHYVPQSNVLDITVEDPSDNFTRLRDFVDCKNCMKLDSFQPEVLKREWNGTIANDARKHLKLSGKQARRVFEILKLRTINRSDKEEFRQYRLEVKKRLNAPFKKLKKGNMSAEDKDVYGIREMKHEELQQLFEELLEEYQHVIERLASSV